MSNGYLCHGGEHCDHGSDSTHWAESEPSRLFVLGADDPEMQAIERLLRKAGEAVAFAVGSDGKRVHPGNAYAAADLRWSNDPADCSGPAWGAVTHLVECAPVTGAAIRPNVVVIDHHRPGDPGYGRGPKEYMPASSIGQVINTLARQGGVEDAISMFTTRLSWQSHQESGNNYGSRGLDLARPLICLFPGSSDEPSIWAEIPGEVVLLAAADHCLESAYRGKCPGVDPDELMRWRAESRAAHQKRPIDAILADIEAARQKLRVRMAATEAYPGSNYYCPHCDTLDHPDCMASAHWVDMRVENIPELPEAACREGIPFLSTVRDRDGREKVVLMVSPPDLVRRFLAGEVVPGLCDFYGDPARGFAGGYTSPK